MDFTKLNGKGRPSAQARRYVYQVLAKTLAADIDNGSEWMWDELDEADQRRVRNAAKLVMAELRKKAETPPRSALVLGEEAK